MVIETKKIMGDDGIRLLQLAFASLFFVAMANPSTLSSRSVTVEEARAALEAAPGITVMDDPVNSVYPMPGLLAGTNGAFVSRCAEDPSVEKRLAFWNVADQIRKGRGTQCRPDRSAAASVTLIICIYV